MSGSIRNTPGQAGLEEAYGALLTPRDSLAQHYTAVASDGNKANHEREAAMLFSVAESKLDDEDGYEDCEKSAREALTLFRTAGNEDGCADAARLIVHALRANFEALKYKAGSDTGKCHEILQQAEKLANEELARFKQQGFKRGQAAMLLSWAEVSGDKLGSHRHEEALDNATAAKEIAAEAGDDKLQAQSALCLSSIRQKMGDREAAVSMADEAATLFRQSGYRKGEAKALHTLGSARVQAELFDDGVQASAQAVALYRELGLLKEEATVNFVIAQYYIGRNLPHMAVGHAQEALEIFKTLKTSSNGSWVAQAHGVVVECLIASGNIKEALRVAEGCRDVCCASKDKRAEALGFSTLSRAHIASDNFKAALDAVEDALSAAQVLNDARWEAHMMRQVGQVHILMRNYTEATRIGQESAGLMQGIQDKHEEAILLNTLGESACEQHDYEAVFRTTQEQRALFQQTGDRSREASCLLASASCIFDIQDRFEESVAMVQEAMDIFEDVRDDRGVARAYKNLSVMYKATGDFESALNSAQNMREKLQLLGDKAAEAAALLLLAEVQILRDNPAAAVKLANEAQSLSRRSGDKVAEVQAWIMVSSSLCENLMQKGQATIGKSRAKLLKPAQEALSMAKKLSNKILIGHALYQVGTVHMITGRIPDAMQAANDARTIFHNKADRFSETAVVMLMAETQYAGGKEDRAVELAEEVLAMAEGTGDGNMVDRATKLIERVRPPQPSGPPTGWVMAQAPTTGAAPSDAGGAAPTASQAVAVVEETKGLDAATVNRAVLEVAKQIVGGEDELTEDAALMDSGLDSLSALSFRQTLQQQVKIKLPSSFVFDYPTVREVTNRIVELSLEQ